MPHDAHFLERLDRVRADETDLALGLYRDHELVRFVLAHAKLDPGADRVAIALADGGDGPWIVVARSGAFVTCLGKGMTPNGLAIIRRAQLDGWSEKHEDVRRRVAIARERGALDRRFIKHVLAAGRWLSREDFLALTAVTAPLAGNFFRTYFETYGVINKVIGPLAFAPMPRGDKQRLAFTQLAHASWSMGHLALAMVEGGDREWLRVVCDAMAAAKEMPTWLPLYEQLAIPFVMRAAWCSAKLGKLALPGCKAEHARRRTTGVELFESGYGLLAIGIRHAGLRAEAFKALRGAHVEGETPWVREMRPWIAKIASIFEGDESRTINDALAFGRRVFHAYHDDFPEGSKYRFADADAVPEDLARTAALNVFHNGAYDREWMPMAATLVTLAARAKAEEFYYPADVYREITVDRTFAEGLALARMHRARTDVPTPIRVEATPGRNDPCSCGSGKKYKKCCGAG